MTIETKLPLLESILGARQSMIGSQYEPYRNHVYRVLNFCFAFHPCSEGSDDREKLVIAACFHDLGIWPDDVVDYLAPSIELAKQYLIGAGKQAWSAEIEMMIDLHHKFRKVTNCDCPLVEVFRKGDWVDASLGLRRFGLPRSYIRDVKKAFPNLGFHRNLLRLTMKQLRYHPLNPIPMMKW